MKKLIFIFAIVGTANSAELMTSCPAGWVSVTQDSITIADSCPSGYVDAGEVTSCITPQDENTCWLFAPTDVSFSDSTGTFQFTEICEYKSD